MIKSAYKIALYNLLFMLSVGFSYFFAHTEDLGSYSLQMTSFILVTYIMLSFVTRKKQMSSKKKNAVNFLLLTLVVFLLVFSSGGLASPIFFLVYFLLFAVSLFFEPSAALSLAFIASLFLLISPKKDLFSEIIQLGSIFIITPLALVFGSQYSKLVMSNYKIQKLEKEGAELEAKVAQKRQEVGKWTYIDFANYMSNIRHSLNCLLSDTSIKESQKKSLESISRDIEQLLVSEKEMEEKVKLE